MSKLARILAAAVVGWAGLPVVAAKRTRRRDRAEQTAWPRIGPASDGLSRRPTGPAHSSHDGLSASLAGGWSCALW
jgi:hypothetical protein